LISAFSGTAAALAQAAAEPAPQSLVTAALVIAALALVAAVWAGWRVQRGLAAQAARLGRLEQTLKTVEEQTAAAARRLDSALSADAQARQQAADRFDQALSSVEASLEQQRATTAQAALALTLLPQAERQYRVKDLGSALATYQHALALNEANPLVHYRLGYIYAQRAQFDQAEQHLGRALALAPDFAPALASLGYVYHRRAAAARPGAEQEKLRFAAEEKLRAALHQAPRLLDEDGESWWAALGSLYRSSGSAQRALRAYQQAADVTPYSSYPLGNLALLRGQAGDTAAMLDTFREVERLARAEVQAAPDDYWPYADLLLARLALGKIQEAEETLNLMLRLLPPDMPHAAASLTRSLTALADLLPDNAATISDVIAHLSSGADTAAGSVNLANETFVITLGDLPALAVRVSDQDDPARIIQLLDLTEARPAIFMLGGAVDMSSEAVSVTRPILEEGLAAYAQERGIAIIDGGTHSGAMQMMGEARQRCRGTFPLVGVAPINLVRFNGHDMPGGYPLDPNHSHFVLTGEGDWGDETDFIVQIAQAITGGKYPALGIVINGGGIVRQEVYRLTLTERLHAPLLVLEGSGRFADTLAHAVRTGETDDSHVREIIARGRIQVAAIADGADTMRQRLSAHFESRPAAS
jgi:tetratricopeptide (TPR) repeat protein